MKEELKIYLIGGASATGKTTIAHELGQQSGVNVLSVDDVRIAAQKMCDENHPINYFIQGGRKIFGDVDIETLIPKHREISEMVCNGLEAIVSHHAITNRSVILEGDDILPEFALAMQKRFHEVKSVFLSESKRELVSASMKAQGRYYDISDDWFQKHVDFVLAENDRIVREAKELDLEVVSSGSSELFDVELS